MISDCCTLNTQTKYLHKHGHSILAHYHSYVIVLYFTSTRLLKTYKPIELDVPLKYLRKKIKFHFHQSLIKWFFGGFFVKYY